MSRQNNFLALSRDCPQALPSRSYPFGLNPAPFPIPAGFLIQSCNVSKLPEFLRQNFTCYNFELFLFCEITQHFYLPFPLNPLLFSRRHKQNIRTTVNCQVTEEKTFCFILSNKIHGCFKIIAILSLHGFRDSDFGSSI